MSTPPNIANASWLSAPETQAVFSAIATGGFSARAVGGAVRNTLMDRPVNDVDLATDAPPREVIRLARAANMSVHETGLQHGTVTIVSHGTSIEVTTLREDVETDGRHATVAFTTDWLADAARRDFTINAIYCDADGTIYDPLGGFPDIAARRVRFIGNIVCRIREDYLRILRFFRFAAIFGDGTLDPQGLAAVTAEQAGLDGISAERIRSELLKTLVADHAAPVLKSMLDTGILARVLGSELNFEKFQRLITMEKKQSREPDTICRLAALAISKPGDAAVLATRLRLANTDRDRLAALASTDRIALDSTAAIKLALYDHGAKAVTDMALLSAAQAGDRSIAEEPLELARSWSIPVFPLKGADLLARGHTPGRNLGQTLRDLETLWTKSLFTLTREELLAASDCGLEKNSAESERDYKRAGD